MEESDSGTDTDSYSGSELDAESLATPSDGSESDAESLAALSDGSESDAESLAAPSDGSESDAESCAALSDVSISDNESFAAPSDAGDYHLGAQGEHIHTCCFICGHEFGKFHYPSRWRKRKPPSGIYAAHLIERMAFWNISGWWCFYRMILFSPHKNDCQISGMALYHQDFYPEFAVPWNKEECSIPDTKTKQALTLAMPSVCHPFQESPKDKLIGYPVHSRCWELLSYHGVWAVAKTNFRRFLDILCQRCRELNYGTLGSEARYDVLETSDPGCIPFVQSLIIQARHRAKKQAQPLGGLHRQYCRLSSLPSDILYLVLENLQSKDVIKVEKAIGSYLGNAYWRSRTPTELFYEVRGIKESVDWKFLCVKLEELSNVDELDSRYQILKCLDEVQNITRSFHSSMN